jgi:hypothetical protein
MRRTLFAKMVIFPHVGFGDFFRQLLGIYPWYCNSCSTRYYKWKRSALTLNTA